MKENIIDKTIRKNRKKLKAEWFTYGLVVGIIIVLITTIIIVTFNL